ncbi:MAG: cytochrome c, partial [Deltaproteobacteria bacterium]|nr:cytochrome c [Deltaproteobacteria bacterium]
MKRKVLLLCCVALSLGLWGCGGSGGGTPSTATISGSLVEDNVALVQAAASHTYTVAAVDENATTRDTATNVTGSFTLEVPVGYDYVLVISDEKGVIGGMTYSVGADQRAVFHVGNEVQGVEVGQIRVDVTTRRAHRDDNEATPLNESAQMYADDHDSDHVPDVFDRDDDNDDIEDQDDRGINGEDMSRDHDNDGIPDEDDHGPNGEDMTNDHDNDGEDDDHDMGSGSGMTGDATNGQTLFENNCVGCHDISGNAGEESIVGTSLA